MLEYKNVVVRTVFQNVVWPDEDWSPTFTTTIALEQYFYILISCNQ